MRADVDVLVVGAGQAGLAVSHELAGAGVDHVVLERDRVGSACAGRWNSFRLVTPNHSIRLLGREYRGADPYGFLPRDEIVDHLRASLGLPVPDLPEPLSLELVAAPPPRMTDLGVAVIACGFRPAYEWIEMPDVVDDMGFPVQQDGASTRVPGLFFVGVPWMRTRKSPLLIGVGEDAAIVVEQLAG
jgi:hypothetical protein